MNMFYLNRGRGITKDLDKEFQSSSNHEQVFGMGKVL